MHMRIDEIKNTRKALLLKSTNASAPAISAKDGLLPLALGGVLGRKKASTPSNKEEVAAILKVNTSWATSSWYTLSMSQPVAIQPSVPQIRTAENSFPGSCI